MDFVGSSKPDDLSDDPKFYLAELLIDEILSSEKGIFSQWEALFDNLTIFFIVY